MRGLNVKLDEKKKVLVIEIPVITPPAPSSTGKTLMVASTRGAVETEVEINGKTLQANLNLYIYASDKVKGGKGGEKEEKEE